MNLVWLFSSARQLISESAAAVKTIFSRFLLLRNGLACAKERFAHTSQSGFAGLIFAVYLRHDDVPKGFRNQLSSFQVVMKLRALILSWTRPSCLPEVLDTIPPFSGSNRSPRPNGEPQLRWPSGSPCGMPPATYDGRQMPVIQADDVGCLQEGPFQIAVHIRAQLPVISCLRRRALAACRTGVEVKCGSAGEAIDFSDFQQAGLRFRG